VLALDSSIQRLAAGQLFLAIAQAGRAARHPAPVPGTCTQTRCFLRFAPDPNHSRFETIHLSAWHLSRRFLLRWTRAALAHASTNWTTNLERVNEWDGLDCERRERPRGARGRAAREDAAGSASVWLKASSFPGESHLRASGASGSRIRKEQRSDADPGVAPGVLVRCLALARKIRSFLELSLRARVSVRRPSI
jgi:hypothetical protein